MFMKGIKKYIVSLVTGIDRINSIIGYILASLILVMVGVLLYEVISRYFFHSPTSWVYEISKMIFGFYMIWAGAHALLHKEHVSMDLFYDRWSPRVKAAMDSFTFVFFIFFVGTLLYKTIPDAMFSVSIQEASNSTLGQPLYHWRVSLIIGIVLLAFQGIAHFIRNLWFATYGEELHEC